MKDNNTKFKVLKYSDQELLAVIRIRMIYDTSLILTVQHRMFVHKNNVCNWIHAYI